MQQHLSIKTKPVHIVMCLFLACAPMNAHAGASEILKKFTSLFLKKESKANLDNIAPVVIPPAQVAVEVFDPKRDFIDVVMGAVNQIPQNYLSRSMVAESIKLINVDSETHTDVQIIYRDKSPVIQFLYDDYALEHPELLLPNLAFISFVTKTNLNSGMSALYTFDGVDYQNQFYPHSIAEILYDAQQGSLSALARLEAIQIKTLESVNVTAALASKIKPFEFKEALLSQKKLAQAELDKQALAYEKAQQKKLDKWKSEAKTLDNYESMDEKLNDLVLNNDRKGVADMLNNYLPWAVMEPAEVKAWQGWLEAIRNPDPNNTTIAYRGVSYDTDKLQRKQTPEGEKIGMLSTVLTKNQGNYTRRLRSLTTNRLKNGDVGFEANGSNVRVVKILDQMIAHSEKPVASNFLSFTNDFMIAARFAGKDHLKEIDGKAVKVKTGGVAVVKIDSRRMIPNVSSRFESEVELLAPLIVFPDEIIAYKEGDFDVNYPAEKFRDELKAKFGLIFIDRMGDPAVNSQLKEKFRMDGMNYLGQLMSTKDMKTCEMAFR